MAFKYPTLSTPSATSQLADFIVNLSFDDLPSRIIEKTKVTVLDTLGCALAGLHSEATQAALNVVNTLGGVPESSIIGVSKKTSPTNAAFVNGIMAKCYDFDGPQIGGHGSPIMIPISLALAEQRYLSGQAIITSIVGGIEVMGRVAKALGPHHQVLHGFHRTATSGVFGATATAGKLLNLDHSQMVHALGIAGSCVGGTEAYLQPGGAWSNAFHCGKPASDGILCALLAQRGFTGPPWILEGIDGILQSYAPPGTTDPAALVDGLAEEWYFGEKLVGYKRYASCGSMHACLDAFRTLLGQYNIDPDDIIEVTTWSTFQNYKFNCTPRESKLAPQSIVEGIFSLPFCLGMLAYRQAITPLEWSEPGILMDQKIRSLARKVNCLVVYDLREHEVRVDVRTKGSQLYTIRKPYAPVFAVAELEEKFMINNSVSSLLSTDDVSTVIGLVKRLDTLADPHDLMGLLAGH